MDEWSMGGSHLCVPNSFYLSCSSGEPCTTLAAMSPSYLHPALWSTCLGVLFFIATDSVNFGCCLDLEMGLALNTRSTTRASLLRW